MPWGRLFAHGVQTDSAEPGTNRPPRYPDRRNDAAQAGWWLSAGACGGAAPCRTQTQTQSPRSGAPAAGFPGVGEQGGRVIVSASLWRVCAVIEAGASGRGHATRAARPPNASTPRGSAGALGCSAPPHASSRAWGGFGFRAGDLRAVPCDVRREHQRHSGADAERDVCIGVHPAERERERERGLIPARSPSPPAILK